MKHIIITGDSWACGEWGHGGGPEYGIIDQGITGLFLQEGYHVINLGCPGGDNWALINPLDNFLWVNTHLDIHRIYYFQTDIGRSFAHKSIPFVQFDHNLDKALEHMYTELYSDLDRIAQQRSVEIHVIGGLTDVTVSLNGFKNLELQLESWCRLINNDLPLVNIGDSNSIDFLSQEFPQYKSQLLPLIERYLVRQNFRERSKYFFPDRYHPNAQGHQLLFQLLRENL